MIKTYCDICGKEAQTKRIQLGILTNRTISYEIPHFDCCEYCRVRLMWAINREVRQIQMDKKRPQFDLINDKEEKKKNLFTNIFKGE